MSWAAATDGGFSPSAAGTAVGRACTSVPSDAATRWAASVMQLLRAAGGSEVSASSLAVKYLYQTQQRLSTALHAEGLRLNDVLQNLVFQGVISQKGVTGPRARYTTTDR